MQTSAVRLYSLAYNEAKTYWFALLFIAGNILLPQLCHTFHLGGPTWLPIYLCTLIGAYKYGWRVGLLTAVVSPLLNAALFGMPAWGAVPSILIKSVLLAIMAGYAAHRYQKVSLSLLFVVVLGYQVVGTLGEWMISGNLFLATQDFRIGVPGMLVQIFGGWAIVKFLLRK